MSLSDLNDGLDIYFRLLFYSELPSSPLRRPKIQWSETEHVAAAMVELLALIQAAQFRFDDKASAEVLASVELHQIPRFDRALVAIGATQQRRLLALACREIIEPFARLDATERVDAITTRIKRGGRVLDCVKYEIDEEALERRLHNYLAMNGELPIELPPPEAPGPRNFESQVSATSRVTNADAGTRSIFLLRIDDATTAVVDSWLQACKDAKHYDAAGITSVMSYSDIIKSGKVKMWGPLACGIVGEARVSAAVVEQLSKYWIFGRNQTASEALDCIAAEFRWAMFQWSTIARTHILAFCSDDDAIADRFATLLNELEAMPISAFRSAAELPSVATGIAFGENSCYGEAALIAAERDGCAPWLVLAANEYSRYWWRSATANLCPQLWHWTSECARPVLVLAYQGVDAATWRKLWSRLSRDDNVAIAAVSGKLQAHELRERLVRVKSSVSVDNLRHLAGDNGWAYAHSWGGGSDEHYAVFYAADAAITARVGAYAADRWPEWARYHSYW
jgi:hypothetical protein